MLSLFVAVADHSFDFRRGNRRPPLDGQEILIKHVAKII